MNVFKIILLALYGYNLLRLVALFAKPTSKVTPGAAMLSVLMIGAMSFLVVMA